MNGEDTAKVLESAMARHNYSGHALIETLHTAQTLYGSLTPALLKEIARKLRLPPSRVYGVATFYHLFRFAPRAKHTAIVCLGTACYVEGGDDILAALNQWCSGKAGWSIETGRCVGSCGLAPIVVCDGNALACVTPAKLQTHLERMQDDSGHAAPDPAS